MIRAPSVGVRDWSRWIVELDKSGSRIYLVNCSPAIVAQINLLPVMVEKVGVISFRMPYSCGSCSHETSTLITLARALEPGVVRAPELPCPECGDPMELDDLESFYFGFLDRVKPPAVDETLRTSAPDVYAAGDVADAVHPFYGRRVRVEHWANALNQGPVAARNMLGADEPYDRIPYFFSDQYEVGVEHSGLARASDEVVLRGDPDARELIAFWIAGGRVAAGMNINVWDVVEPIQALIRSRAPVDPARLADPAVPLDSLLPAPSR